jgi:hypothetical protein
MYNPGNKGNYNIKIKIDESPLNIVDSNNLTIVGEIICPNPTTASNCELIFNI